MDDGIYNALARVLQDAARPLTCHDVFEDIEVQRLAEGELKRVSDYLGNMWRQGAIKRVPAAYGIKTAKARYAYEWPRKLGSVDVKMPKGDVIMDTPKIKITRDGRTVTLTLPNLTITIDQT